jgi:predicted amidohydrolase
MNESNRELFKVAAIQMVSTPEPAQNYAVAERLVRVAAQQGAKLALLPEYWPVMGLKDTDKLALAEGEGGEIQMQMAAMAKDNGIWLIGGTLPLATADVNKVLNTTLVYNPQGEMVARYDKIHLFSFSKGEEFYDEANTIEHGGAVKTFEAPFGRVGLSVCYDLRFPELYRAMGSSALCIHLHHRQGALGAAAAGSGDRKPMLRACRSARRQACERPAYLGPYHADRPLGRNYIGAA